MELIDGNQVASDIIDELKNKVAKLETGKPCVAFIRVGDDPASVSYKKKEKTAASIGIESKLKVLPNDISQAELLNEISDLNSDGSVHGILVQAILPSHIDETTIFNHVSPEKDVDGFNATNLGKVMSGER